MEQKNLQRLLFVFCCCVCFCTGLFSQDRALTGIVKDEAGETLPGATVAVKGSEVYSITNVDGIFAITVPAGFTTLIVSYVGMETREVALGVSNFIEVDLLPSATALSELVVVGYGTTRRANVTSSISSLDEKAIKNLPVAGADQALQGKVAGVTVTSNTGQPGGGVSVRVRGITSVNNNEPLYVIDGVPILSSSTSTPQDQLGGTAGQSVQSVLATLNPSDIASIDILKDASAQAIYGSQGANGVVLITTKKGKSGEGKIAYDTYFGIQNVQRKLPLMDLSEYARFYNSVVAEGTVAGLAPIGEFNDPSILGRGTDWQDEVFQQGQTQNHQLSFSGGNGKTTYFLSGNYYNQKGIVTGSGFKRYAARLSVDQQVKSWLKGGMSINLSKTDQRITLTDGQQSVIDLMLYNSPATPVRGFDGNYTGQVSIAGVPFGNNQNPVALAELRNVSAKQTKAFGSAFADITFLKDFTLRNQINYDIQLSENNAFQPLIRNENTGQLIIGPNRYRQDMANSFYYGFQTYLTYNKTLAQHHNINVVAGHEAAESRYVNQYGTVINITQNLQSLNAGTVDPSQTNGGIYEWAMESYFGRVNYNYRGKYALSASIRTDGSASFGPDNRWGTFSAVSAGWTISNENFAQNWGSISYLKLRAGYGQVGNSTTAGSNVFTTNIRLASNASGLFGQTVAPGVPANVGNPALSWESVNTLNAGIDAGLFNDRIVLALDVYQKVSTNMILSTILPIFSGLDPTPPNNSYQDIQPPVTNAGKMTNTGIDISLSTRNIVGQNFSWTTDLIFSHYKNTLNELNSESASIAGFSPAFTPRLITLTQSGHPVGGFYGFVTNGLFRSMTDLENAGTYPLPISPTGLWLGDVRYVDLDGNGVVDDMDVTYIGSPHPKFTFGFTNQFAYKNFDLSIFLQGVYGSKIFNISRMQTEALFNVYQNQFNTVLDRYTEDNPDGALPRYNQWNTNNLRISDRFVEDGSYLRIQNVSLGFRFPAAWLNRVRIGGLRVFVSGQNLHTFTKYTGYDPELGAFNGGITRMNIDYGAYPNPRSIIFGANIEF